MLRLIAHWDVFPFNTQEFRSRREPGRLLERQVNFGRCMRTISPSSVAVGETCLGGCETGGRPEEVIGVVALAKAPEEALEWEFAGRMQKARALDESCDSFVLKGR
jgi:hypothetical protein